MGGVNRIQTCFGFLDFRIVGKEIALASHGRTSNRDFINW